MKNAMNQVNKEETLKDMCYHKNSAGKVTLKTNDDGSVTCTMCGKTFKPIDDLSYKEVQEMCNKLSVVIQMTQVNLGSQVFIKDVETLFKLERLSKDLPRLYMIGQERLRDALNNK